MAGIENLVPNSERTPEKVKENATKAGVASGVARRARKTMRETAKTLLAMPIQGKVNQDNLKALGIDPEDRNYQTAIVVKLMQQALTEGNTGSARLLSELTGDLRSFDIGVDAEARDGEIEYPAINIPNNGRDDVKRFELAPQPGPQTAFMASSADVIIYGGSAGGGKTYALLLEALRHKDVKGFQAAIFRSNYTQVTAPGGLWDASQKIFTQVPGAHSGKTPKLHWSFDGGAKLTFAHIGCEDDLLQWQGSEIAYIGFDEATHFTRHMFLYMLSRNRSTCGIRPYVRATCNPDADSWVAKFIEWWIDPDTGYPIKERSGRIRWMHVENDEIYFADTPEELAKRFDCSVSDCKSVTFIASSLQDNKILMQADPGYLANLKALPQVDMERLLYGNWKIKAAAGLFFKRSQVTMLEVMPADLQWIVRAWDLAATADKEDGDPDYTAGVLMGIRKDKTIAILDVINQRIKAGEVEKLVYNTSVADRQKYGSKYRTIRIPQDPGAAGKIVAANYVKKLIGFSVKVLPVSGNKQVRATPFAAYWQNGNVEVLAGNWNDMYFSQLESFPESRHDDMVDASSDAFNELTGSNFNLSSMI